MRFTSAQKGREGMEPGVEPRSPAGLFQQAEDGAWTPKPRHIKELRLLGRADWWTTWVPRLNRPRSTVPTLCPTLLLLCPCLDNQHLLAHGGRPLPTHPHLPSSSSPPSGVLAPDTLEAKKKALDRAPDGSAALEQRFSSRAPRPEIRGGPGNHLLL